MEYPTTLELKWFYLKEDNQLPYETFSIVDENGFIIARSIQEENVAGTIVYHHNKWVSK